MHSTTAQPVFFCCSVGALKSSPKSHSKEVGFALGQRSQASCKLRAYSQHKVLHLPAKARPAGSGEAEQNCSPACRRVLVAPCPPRAPTCSHRRRRRAWRRSCGPWRRRGTHTPCPLSAPTCSHRHRRHAWRWRSCVQGTRRRQGMRTCSRSARPQALAGKTESRLRLG